MPRDTQRSAVLIVALLLLALVVGFSTSCQKPPSYEYTGPNDIRVVSTDHILSPQRKESITVTLQRSITSETQALKIIAKEDPLGTLIFPDQVEFVDTARSVSLEVKLKEGVALTEVISPQLLFTLQPDQDTASVKIMVKNSTPLPKYTSEQDEIIAHWIGRGIPLDKILGRDLPVAVTVSWPSNGGLAPFSQAGSHRYEGVTVLTLSSKATRDSLVLRFHENAFGMTPFFYYAHRQSTVENKENWYGEFAGPFYTEVMKLINWTATSSENFECTLDSVAIGLKNGGGISPVNTMYDHVRDEAIRFNTPFDFYYTAWERLKEKIAEGNPKALEIEPTDASPWPHRLLNRCDFHFSVDRKRQPPYANQYDYSPLLPQQNAYINWNTGQFHFDLATDISDAAGGYIQFKGIVQLLPEQ